VVREHSATRIYKGEVRVGAGRIASAGPSPEFRLVWVSEVVGSKASKFQAHRV